jgi:SOS response associated peptidase (SRAP)
MPFSGCHEFLTDPLHRLTLTDVKYRLSLAQNGLLQKRISRNELVAQIHPRMPVILPEQHHAAWLRETDNGNLKELLLPHPADEMRMWEISPWVNSPKNDDASLWEPPSCRARARRLISGVQTAAPNPAPRYLAIAR